MNNTRRLLPNTAAPPAQQPAAAIISVDLSSSTSSSPRINDSTKAAPPAQSRQNGGSVTAVPSTSSRSNNAVSSSALEAAEIALLSSEVLGRVGFTLNCVQFINLVDMANISSSSALAKQSAGPLPASRQPTVAAATSSVVAQCFPCIVCASQFSYEQVKCLFITIRESTGFFNLVMSI